MLVSRGESACSVLDASGRLTSIIPEGLMVVHLRKKTDVAQ